MRGRAPRVPGCASEATIRVRVTPSERADLVAVALEHRRPLAEVIREAVNEYVADYRERAIFVVQNSNRGVG